MTEFYSALHHEAERSDGGPPPGMLYGEYGEQIAQILIGYTGSSDVYISYPRSQELAAQVQRAAPIDEGEFLSLDYAETVGAELTERQRELQVARFAIQELVGCNLRFAKTRADASVGLHPPSKPFSMSFTDVRKLRTPMESYADRVQAANLGLVVAATKYKPHMVDKRTGDPLSFVAFTRMHIDNALYEWALGCESRFFQVSANTRRQMQKDADDATTSAETRSYMARFLAVQESVSFEEIEPDDIVDHTLAHDPTADAVITAVAAKQCLDQIAHVYSPRAAAITAASVFEGSAEAAAALGVSRTRVNQIVNEAAKRIQNVPERAKHGLPESTHHERMVAFGINELIRHKDLFRRTTDFTETPLSDRAAMFVERAYGAGIRAKHIETMWNNHWDTMVNTLKGDIGKRFDLKQFSQVMALLLGNVIRRDEVVTLRIPPHLQGELPYVGAWAKRGRIMIIGDTGDFTGAFKERRASVVVMGSVGKYAGFPDRPSSIAVHPNI